jgi:hypothetical protein
MPKNGASVRCTVPFSPVPFHRIAATDSEGRSHSLLSTLGRPPSLVARERRYQAVPSPRNRERSGEQRNAATLQWCGRAGRLRTSHEWRRGMRRARGSQRHSLLSDPAGSGVGCLAHQRALSSACSWRARKARMPPRASRSDSLATHPFKRARTH